MICVLGDERDGALGFHAVVAIMWDPRVSELLILSEWSQKSDGLEGLRIPHNHYTSAAVSMASKLSGSERLDKLDDKTSL